MTHSFIVKIWLEEPASASRYAVWRGHITHVPDGDHFYLQELDDLAAFVAPYVQHMGGRAGRCWALRRWICSWRTAIRQPN